MAGLDNIIEQIIEEAKCDAARIVDAARKEADAILADAKNECEAFEQEASEKEKVMRELQESRMQSSVEQQRKIAVLRAKQEVIQDVMDEAYLALKQQDVTVYFETIEKLIGAYALAEAGEIYFSKTDLERMPINFEQKISEAALKAGGSLVLMNEPRLIEDGFVLVYGGIEENCTFRALLDAKKDEFQDTVQRILFG